MACCGAEWEALVQPTTTVDEAAALKAAWLTGFNSVLLQAIADGAVPERLPLHATPRQVAVQLHEASAAHGLDKMCLAQALLRR